MSSGQELPRWLDLVVLPLFNLALALLVCGIVVLVIGQDPLQVLALLVKGAFGSRIGLSYTLYYATTFVFTGLAVAVAFHGGLFNIGGEGQAMLGGIGTALVALALADHWPAWLVLPLMVLAAALFGMAWAAVPAALQAWRGSHVVITTIMFNFIASALLSWLLVNVLKEPGNMTVESRSFGPGAHVPALHEVLALAGHRVAALAAQPERAARARPARCWCTCWCGARGRATCCARSASRPRRRATPASGRARQIMFSMMLSGALAGLVGINEVAGTHGRLLLDYVVGAGFAGIAVSLIGRNHPVGIVLASLLFGALYQGGAELAFEIAGFSRDMVFTLQGLIVLFSGAMAQVAAPTLARLWFCARAPLGWPAHG